MPEMVTNFDVRVAASTGHVFEFKRNKPMFVPERCMKEVMGHGAIPADGKAPDLSQPDEINVPAGAAWEEAIVSAFYDLIAKNESNDFGADGRPKVHALKRELGFKVDRNDIDKLWEKHRPVDNPELASA